MKNVFIDTNVILDILGKREPFYASAAELFSKVDQNKLKASISSLSVVTVNYILSRHSSENDVRELLRRFRVLVNILPCDEKIIDLGLNSHFKDFEDAIQYNIALENNLDCIITRNLKDFKGSKIPVMTADEFLKSYSIS